VSLIANIIEPERGTVLDPACGSGGMFVQSAHFVERLHQNPSDKLTFRGLEKNATTPAPIISVQKDGKPGSTFVSAPPTARPTGN